MQFHVLGAGQDVGRSCGLLTTGSHHLLLDCGAHHGFDDHRRYPAFSSLPPDVLSTLDAVLISHFHFDHVGALPLLVVHHQCRAPLYMTEPTRDLARLVLLDVIATSQARSQHCPFTESDVLGVLNAATLIHPGQAFTLPHALDVQITPFIAGHCIGAVMFLISFPDGLSAMYSGDYSIRSDRYVPTAKVPFGLRPTVFITEATYCNVIRSPSRIPHVQLIAAISDTLRQRGKILIPIPALGRIHSIAALLSSSLCLHALQHVPIYVASGLATRANEVYSMHRQWSSQSVDCVHCPSSDSNTTTNRCKRSRFANACPHDIMSRLSPFNRNDHWDSVVRAPGPTILFTTPSSLSTGLSRDVYREWSLDHRNLIVIPSANFTSTIAADPTTEFGLTQSNDISQSASIRVSCKLANLPACAHPDRGDIFRMCKHLNAQNVILVHGDRAKILAFQKEVEQLLSMKCYAPANGETVEIFSTPQRRQKPVTLEN